MGTLCRIVREFARDVDAEFSGTILRPHAFVIDEHPDKDIVIHDACKQVGNQLITKGRMSRRLIEVIGQPLVSEDALRQRYNDAYQRVIS